MSRDSGRTAGLGGPAGDADGPALAGPNPAGDTSAEHENQAADGHLAAHEHEQEAADEWPNLHDLAHEKLAAEMRDALAVVTVEPLLELLKKMSPRPLSYVMRALGLRKAARVNRGMASALLASLRARPSQDLLAFMFTPLLMTFEHAHLDADQWVRFLSADDAELEDLYEESPALLGHTESCERLVPVALLRLGLAVAAVDCVTHVPALAFLTRYSESAASLYEELRHDRPELPPAAVARFEDRLPSAVLDGPRSPARTRHDVVTEDDFPTPGPAETVPASEAAADHAAPVAAASGSLEATGSGPIPADVEAILDLVDSLDWEQAATLAADVAADLHAGSAPTPHRVGRLLDFTERAHQAAAALADQSHRPVTATVADIDAAVLDLRRDDETDELLTALAAATGPADLAEAVAAVRDAAAEALATTADPERVDALTALARIARATAAARTGSAPDYTQIAAFESSARATLPPAALPALTAALLGALVIPDELPRAVDEEPAADVEGAAADIEEPAAEEEGASADIEKLAAEEEGVAAMEGTAAEVDSAPHADHPGVEDTDDAAATVEHAEVPPMGDTAEGTPETPAPAAAAADPAPAAADERNLPEVPAPEDATDAEHPADIAGLDLSEIDDFLRSADAGTLRIRDHSTDPTPAEPTPEPAVCDSHPDPDTTTGADAVRDEHPDAPTIDHDQLIDLEARLLTEGRFGLASHLHTDPSAAAARRLAAYQAHITSATGTLATAFSADQALVSREGLAEDRAGQRLAWAAAARVAIVAPATGAAAVLRDLAPCMAQYPTLGKIGEALAEASLSGAIALPEHSDDLSAVTDATATATSQASDARTLLETAPRRALKYAPANWVYQHLMAPDGTLGDLLASVVANDPARAEEVRDRIVELRRTGDRLIDDTFDEVNKSSKYRRIEAGARQRLTQRIEEALDLASTWADAATAIREHKARLHGAASASRPLDKLRSTLESLRGQARNELGRMRAGAAKGTAAGRLDAAAAEAVTSMVVATFATATGNPPRGGEPTPAWAVSAELLATDLTLDPSTLAPTVVADEAGAKADRETRTGDDVTATILDLAANPARTYEAMYERRAGRGEHDLTEVLVTNLAQVDPDQAAPLLRARRDADVAATLPAVAAEIARVTDQVNSRRRDETLTEPVWSALLADLESLRDPHRRDFAAIRRALARVEAVVEENKLVLVEQARTRIEQKAAEDPLVAKNRDTLLDIISRGDVSGAYEFLEQLTSGTPLPESRHDDVHLRRFFPAVPDLAAAHPDLLRELHATLNGRKPTTAVADLFDQAHVDPATAARSVGSRALGAWTQLAERSKSDVDLGTILKPILAVMGLEFSGGAELDRDRPAGRRFATLRGVGGPAKAMSPVLGSDMGGPSPNTLRVLLVWGKDTTPTTLIDWLREVPPDRSVLVLYLPGALTADQRRALATAARGQSRPPAIVVDAALMAYLACQTEPSRTTLAFTTLPFTADSPYADRPGNTPEEMFYGRVGERQKVIDLNGPSFISGGRQLGKSALLRSAEREFNKMRSQRALWLDVTQVGADGRPEELWPVLDAELRRAGIIETTTGTAGGPPTAASVSHDIHTWLHADPERALLLLIDEADHFLSADAADSKFANVGACKRLMDSESRRVKFVFTGLHRTSRFESLSNQPLAHMGKPIVVGPLRPQAAQDLITRPMAAMGFTFADPTVQTARILAATNSVPSLLQLFGRAMIAHLTSREVGDGPPQEITDADIATVLDDPELAAEFREKYILTLNLDHRYQVIVHAVALAAYENGVDLGLRLNELADLCRQYWPAGFADLPIDYLRGLVTECCDLGLLTLDNGSYRMRTPYVLRLLGTAEEVAEVLFNADERLTLPSSTNAGSYRARMRNSHHRAPLTARQVGKLLDAPGQTRVVAGTEALAVQRAVHCLEQVAEEGRAAGLDIRRLKSPTGASLIAQAGRLTKATLLLVDLRHVSVHQVDDVLTACPKAHAAAAAPLTVVVVADTGSAPAWVTHTDDLVALTRVDAPGLRLWAAEANAPFHTPEELQALAEATAGWPLLVERALESSGPASSERCLTDLTDWLSSPAGARTFLTACGLRSNDQPDVAAVLADAFAAVAEWTSGSGADLVELAETIGEDGGLAARAAAAGFAGMTDVVTTLQLCGMLVSDPENAQVSAEPVLARVVTAAVATVGGR
jgi:hypothetical protein